jgi:hypothetical protein
MDPILIGMRMGFDLGDIEFGSANALVSKFNLCIFFLIAYV